MKPQPDAMLIVQSQICEAIERLHAGQNRMSDAQVARAMTRIEAVANDHGLAALARVTRAGMYAAARPGYRVALARHLERMEDAIGCQRLDDDATGAIMASIALRLA